MKNALYNSLNNKLIYVKDLGNLNDEERSLLINNNFLVEDDNKLLNSIQKTIPQAPSIYNALFLLTDSCNFRCKYCYIETPEFLNGRKFQFMSIDTAKLACDKFIENYDLYHNKGSVTFYGGEPLLNKKVLYFVVDYLNNAISKGKIPHIEFILVTNGSLITDEDASNFKRNNIKVSISIDGPKETNDKMRTNLKGSAFDSAINGYNICKKYSVDLSISCTITKYNIDILDKIAKYFTVKLKVKSMAFNIPITVSKNDPGYVDSVLYSTNIINAFKILRGYGVYEDRIMRSVISFVNGNIRIRDCNGCGLQVVFHPNGNYGPCQALLVNDEEVAGNIHEKDYKFEDNYTFKKWARRSPYLIDTCIKCSVLASCGGGCAYTAKMQNGDINTPDYRICSYSEDVTKWLINEHSKSL